MTNSICIICRCVTILVNFLTIPSCINKHLANLFQCTRHCQRLLLYAMPLIVIFKFSSWTSSYWGSDQALSYSISAYGSSFTTSNGSRFRLHPFFNAPSTRSSFPSAAAHHNASFWSSPLSCPV